MPNGDARPWIFLTNLGGWPVLLALTLAAAVYLFARGAPELRGRAFLLLSIVLGGRAVVALLKVLVGRERPSGVHLVETHSMSFPSGHAANALITFLALALLVPMKRANRVWLALTGAVLALLIGVSRVVLGVHWPSDVVGGWVFGLLWVLAWTQLGARASAIFSSRSPART